MEKKQVALGMIVGADHEAEMLDRCLASVAPYVDGIYLTITKTPCIKLQKVAKKYGAKVDIRSNEFERVVTKKEVDWLKKFLGSEPNLKVDDKIFPFDKARQANLDFIPDEYEWFLWLDADDVLRRGENLRPVLNHAKSEGTEAIFLNYLYQVEFDEKKKIKNIIIQHLREQLIRIDGKYRENFKWVGAIHETLISSAQTKKKEYKEVDRLHLSTQQRFDVAMERNLRVLESEIFRTKGTDPRPIYYLGKSYYDQHKPESRKKARKLILTYISPTIHNRNMSGWKEERSQAWEYLGELCREDGEHNNSLKCFWNSLGEWPENRGTYFNIGVTYVIQREFNKARFWAILGSKIPPAKSTLANNPRDIESRFYEIIFNCGVNLHKLDESWAAIEKLREIYPDKPNILQQWNFINKLKKEKEVTKSFGNLVGHLNTTGQSSKLKALLAATPKALTDNPLIVKLYHDIFPPRTWGKKEITLYCGPQFTNWSPKALADQGNSFIGGSEEAVIYLTKELTDLGWKVTVYASPGENAGEYDGVKYEPHYNFNIRDKFNILVYWRSVGFSDMLCKAKKTYLWCHDVQSPSAYTKENVKRFTKLIVLSKAHRENLPDIPDKKFMISSNGYHEHLSGCDPDKDQYSMLWTSSYDRGLEHLLNMWPNIKKAVPQAKLNIFYGWKLFETFYKSNPERMAWKRKIEELMKQPGITHYGRVTQPEIEQWYKKCGIWAYPTHFYEINCISAIKAQLWGAVPVVIDYAALKETVKYGKKIKGDIWDKEVQGKFTKELVEALKNKKWQEEERKKMGSWARNKYGWDKIAKKWTKEFEK